MLKIVLIGCLETSYRFLEAIVNIPEASLNGVVTRASSQSNSDFRDLKPLATRTGSPCFHASGKDQKETAAFIRSCQPDVVYCFGWSHILGKEILDIAQLGVVGFHPTALPQNRGRHPIVWALALGLSCTATTFFFMDEGADSGDILSQQPLSIDPEDDAALLYEKVVLQGIEQIREFTPQLDSRTFPRVPQNHSRANSWRKRGISDGEIDWRMSFRSIHNLVRALTRPYPGAHCIQRGSEIKIWKTQPVASAPDNMEPGRILELRGNEILVKAGEGAVRLTEHEFTELPSPGSYLS